MERIKQLLKAETEFTNRHLSRSQQIWVGIVISLVMVAITFYYLYAN